ncbi:MAG TPA: aminotransferase class V-fold PLP-dependent enzyme, partial [Geminicoccaceae bacterium]
METGAVYLDHLASTPLDPRVRDVMLPWLDAGAAGNPHSAHRAGWRAAAAVEQARDQVAALIGARPGEIVLTSGATEANNLALFGASRPGDLVIASAVEHPSVLACLPALERQGRRIRTVAVDRDGRIRPDALEEALGQPTPGGTIVSVMA